jgi:hypothetical protein
MKQEDSHERWLSKDLVVDRGTLVLGTIPVVLVMTEKSRNRWPLNLAEVRNWYSQIQV